MIFPNNFIWGVATADYQIEGGYDEDCKGRGIWDDFCHLPEKISDEYTGDVAVDFYHRYPDDLSMLTSLGGPALRFSVSWPRIIPDGTGHVNEKVLIL